MRAPHLHDTLRRFCLGAFAVFTRDLDVEQALVIRIADGLLHEVTAVPLDSAFERFWA
jgi:hypothetical protein